MSSHCTRDFGAVFFKFVTVSSPSESMERLSNFSVRTDVRHKKRTLKAMIEIAEFSPEIRTFLHRGAQRASAGRIQKPYTPQTLAFFSETSLFYFGTSSALAGVAPDLNSPKRGQ
jgi:hypothetical protein